MKYRYWLLAIGYAGLIFLGSSFSIPPLPFKPVISIDKVAHFIEYAILGYLLYCACYHSTGLVHARATNLSLLLSVLYAFSDEWHQLYVPGRQTSEWDFLFDALGAITMILIMTKIRPVNTSNPADERGKTLNMLSVIAIVYGIGFLLGIGGIWLARGTEGIIESFKLSIISLWLGALCALMIILLTMALGNLRIFERLEEEFQRLLGRLKLSEIIIIALASGIGEETIFRGAIQPHLGLILTSVIFGMLHFPLNRSLIPWTGFAVAMGFVLGGLYIYTNNNLIAPITTHCLVNLVNLYRIADKNKSDTESKPTGEITLPS